MRTQAHILRARCFWRSCFWLRSHLASWAAVSGLGIRALRQAAAGCGGLRQVVASCRRLPGNEGGWCMLKE